MDMHHIINKAQEAIVSWAKDNPKLVVVIDGYTGVGKTTLLNKLTGLNSDILPVNRDDFLLPREILEILLHKTDDKSKIFELEVCDIEKIEKLISAFRAGNSTFSTKVYNPISGKIDTHKSFDLTKRILVMEGVFMFHPKLTNHLWDKRIYLDGDIQKIDERRVNREKERWGKDYFSEDHPDSYFRQVTTALKRYREQYAPEAHADLVLFID